MTRTELNQAIATAKTSLEAAWAAWVAVRDAGQTDLRCPEFQAHNAAQAEVSRLHSIVPTETAAAIHADYQAAVQLIRAGRAADRRDNPDMYR